MNIASEGHGDNTTTASMFFSFAKKLILLCLAVFMFATACKRRDADLPEYVLDRETMTAVLTDIHLIESALKEKQNQGLLAFELSEIYFDSLCAKYDISRTQIDSSIAYYSRRPEIFDAIYVKVITNLSKKESEIKVETDTTQLVPDHTEQIPESKESSDPEPGREIREEQSF
jgi:hypothetical protein